jgi:hypothetical protein
MPKKLVLIGGFVNAAFTLFHIFLTYRCWTFVGISAALRALLTMLNVGGVLMILLFTLTFLLYPDATLTTGPGRLSLLFCALVYGTRAVEEVVLTSVHPSWIILATCATATALFVAIHAMTRRTA